MCDRLYHAGWHNPVTQPYILLIGVTTRKDFFMTALTEFSYQNTGIRMLGTRFEPWFVAVDVLRALDISPKYMARTLSRLDDDEKMVVNLNTEDNSVAECDGIVDVAERDTIGELPPKVTTKDDCSPIKLMGEVEIIQGSHNTVWIVSEPGLYKIMLRSRTPTAEAFTRFVTHEVLPQIRKTGKYIPPKPKRSRGRPALPAKTYEITTGERMGIEGLRAMCIAFEHPKFNYESRFIDATAEECVEYINSEIASGNRPRYDMYDDGEKDETYWIVVEGKRMEIPS